MDSLEGPLVWHTVRTTPFITPHRRITPVAHVLGVRWNGGAWMWQFPVWVEVEEDGRSRRIPILPVTRLALWLFQGMTLLSIVLVAGAVLRRRKRHEEK